MYATYLTGFLSILFTPLSVSYGQSESPAVLFSKTTISNRFISEGVTVTDVNNDGIIDIISGAHWFEGPHWEEHDVYEELQVFDGTKGYSNSMLNFAIDVDQDGWTDYIRIGFPGKEIVWYRNPGKEGGYWEEHTICLYNGNESPLFKDVDQDGREDIICADARTNEMVWYRCPPKKGDVQWRRYVIGGEGSPGAKKFSHGLGYGDINGDGRPDVVVTEGWWEAPDNPYSGPWKFHAADLGEPCAQMHVMDVNGDGLADVLSSSAHRFGMWWHEQLDEAAQGRSWQTHEIFMDASQLHTLNLADINGDGHVDLVTGMRYLAHMGRDPGEQSDPTLFWMEFLPGKNPQWRPHVIDSASGAGLNFEVADMNADGLLDIVIANKKGVFYFEQKREE